MTDTTDPQADRSALVEGPQTVTHNANDLRRKLASSERIRENADFHLGQEMARRQLAEKETARLWAVVARLRQMTDHWEQQLPEVIRTPAVVAAIRAALEAADAPSRVADEAQQPCPGFETQPNRCSCPCEGCKHHCAAHQSVEAPQPCDGCGHPVHPSRQCPVVLYGETCTCDEPLVGEAQQPETQTDDEPPCTCAVAGDCFAPAGHYADCPRAEQPAAVSQPGKEA